MEIISLDKLEKIEGDLIEAARGAIDNAYSPQNNIKFGTAVLVEDDKIVTAANYGVSSALNICAERAAIVTANSLGFKIIKTIAIYCPTEEVSSPCGSCRQFIYEAGQRNSSDVSILISNMDGRKICKTSIAELLPNPYKR